MAFNNSGGKGQEIYTFSVEWITVEIFNGLFAATSLYLLLVSIIYEYKTRRSTFAAPSARIRRVKVMMAFATPVACFLVLGGFICTQFAMLVTFFSGFNACTAFRVTGIWCLNLGQAVVFLMLWLRIKLFYTHRIMQTLQTGCVRALNHAILGLLVVSAVQQAVVFTVSAEVQPMPNHLCVHVSMSVTNIYFSLVFMAVTSVICIVMLGLLLVCPLWRNRRQVSDNTLLRLKSVFYRMVVVTILCICSFVLAPAVSATIRHRNMVVSHTIYCLVLLANIVFVTCSFADWRCRFFPFYYAPIRGSVRSQNSYGHKTVAATVSTISQPNAYVTRL